MKRFQIYEALWLSFFSRELYQDVARHWSGTTFLYLLLVVALSGVPATIQKHHWFQQLKGENAEALLAQIPTIEVREGQVSVDVDTPYFIKDPINGEILLVIDTTGEITSVEDTSSGLLLTRTDFVFKLDNQDTRSIPLSQYGDFTVDREDAAFFLNFTVNWVAVLTYPFEVLFSFLYRIVQAFFYAAIGILFARSAGAALKYPALLRLAIVAVTPAIVLATAARTLGVTVPWSWLIWFAVAMAYLHYGITAAAEDDSPTTFPATPGVPE